jgi:ubiquinone/menaquinone biosynthesis C-methylase UbiE
MKFWGERKPYTIPLPTSLIDAFGHNSKKSVLDIGCGYGRACFFLHENGFKVVGVDVDRTQVGLAQEEKKSRRMKEPCFLLNDAENLCFPDSCFDAVTMLGVLTLAPKPKRSRIVSEADRVLKMHGHFLIEEFGRTWENPVYAQRYRNDIKETSEQGTVTVRDEAGKVLHFGHHFTRREILNLLKVFRIVHFQEHMFTSYYHKNWVKGYIILARKRTG